MQMRIKDVFEEVNCIDFANYTFTFDFYFNNFYFFEDGLRYFYTQNRNGKFNKPIKITKLRTMQSNAEKDGVQWSKKNDPLQKLVILLEKIRLDELPQLISVIKGEMSLIGPRPERPGN